MTAQKVTGQPSLISHGSEACGFLCLASRLTTVYRSPAKGYRQAIDAELVSRPWVMIVWVDAWLRRNGAARQLVDAVARHASRHLALRWAEPSTDSGYLLATPNAQRP